MPKIITVGLICLFLAKCRTADSGDWPQLLGPHRDGHAVGESLVDWSVRPPKILWKVSVGSGYAGPTVQADRVILAHRRKSEELLTCLSARDGQPIWQAKFSATYRPSFNPDDGPLCTPVIDKYCVIFYGAAGDLRCIELATGKVRWELAVRFDLEAPDGYFGAGSSPLVIDDTVVVCPGSKQGAVVGIGLGDGKIRWQVGSMEAAYASPIRFHRGEEDLVLAVLRMETWLLDPKNGKVRARTPFGKSGPTVNAATPLVNGNRSLLTASYEIGAKRIDWGSDRPRIEWEGDQILSSQYATPVLVGEQLFGVHGRDDIGIAALRCVNWADGKVRWTSDGFGTAHLIAVDAQDLLALKTNGELTRLRVNPDQFEAMGKFNLPTGTYRAAPALSGGVVYCRNTDNGTGQLIAVQVGL